MTLPSATAPNDEQASGIRIRDFSASASMPSALDPLVSVVVPTCQAGATLSATLASLERQSYRAIEIFVVDNGSTDATLEIARAHSCTVVAGSFGERSAQLNQVLPIVSGKYFYRVDADFVLPLTLVEEAVRMCERRHLDAVLIHNASDPSLSKWASVRNFERDMYRGDDLNVAARFVRTDLLREIGGHDERLVGGEDYDVHRRLVEASARIGRIEAEETHVGEPTTLGEVWRKHVYYGRTMEPYLRKHGWFAVRQLSPVRPAFTRNWRAFLHSPRIALRFSVYQGVKYTAGIFGLLSGFVQRHGTKTGKE
jgi:glycosyltransferase involved in cell wall biosynthesis